METQNKNIIELALIPVKLLLICAAIALLVSFVNANTADIIAAYEEAKTNAALAEAFPEAKSFSPLELPEGLDKTVTSAHVAINSDAAPGGYAVMCEPMGFKDIISMMVSFETDGTVESVRIISLSETTGIGDKVMSDESFTAQFGGKTGELTVGNNVDAIAGATISSKAVTAGVNSAIACVSKIIDAKGGNE